jgi:lipid A disaccharide synthetase
MLSRGLSMNLSVYFYETCLVKVPSKELQKLKKPLVREFIQNKVSVETLSQEALAIMNNPGRFDSMRKELISIRNLLGEKGTSEKVAKKIIEYIT